MLILVHRLPIDIPIGNADQPFARARPAESPMLRLLCRDNAHEDKWREAYCLPATLVDRVTTKLFCPGGIRMAPSCSNCTSIGNSVGLLFAKYRSNLCLYPFLLSGRLQMQVDDQVCMGVELPAHRIRLRAKNVCLVSRRGKCESGSKSPGAASVRMSMPGNPGCPSCLSRWRNDRARSKTMFAW